PCVERHRASDHEWIRYRVAAQKLLLSDEALEVLHLKDPGDIVHLFAARSGKHTLVQIHPGLNVTRNAALICDLILHFAARYYATRIGQLIDMCPDRRKTVRVIILQNPNRARVEYVDITGVVS